MLYQDERWVLREGLNAGVACYTREHPAPEGQPIRYTQDILTAYQAQNARLSCRPNLVKLLFGNCHGVKF